MTSQSNHVTSKTNHVTTSDHVTSLLDHVKETPAVQNETGPGPPVPAAVERPKESIPVINHVPHASPPKVAIFYSSLVHVALLLSRYPFAT